MPEDLKRYVVVQHPLRERLRRPSLERSPTAALAQMYFRGSGGELTRRALLDVPVAAVSQVLTTAGLAAAGVGTAAPLVKARAQSRLRRRLHRSALQDRKSFDDYDVEILASRLNDLTLIRASERTAQALREAGVTLVDDAPVYPARARPPSVRRRKRPGPRRTRTVEVTSAAGRRIRGAVVTGLMADGEIDFRRTGHDGIAALDVTDTHLVDVWVDPVPGHWSWSRLGMASAEDHIVASLTAIDDDHVDGLRHRYPDAVIEAGKDVRVGVIDTGVGPHDEISIHGGRDYRLKPNASNYGAEESDHGTHVAGVIASRAGGPRRGLAPGVELRSYRIYTEDEQASVYTLALAIPDAIEDGCDIINLSITMDTVNELVAGRVQKALDAGVIVVAAAGNTERQPLAFPASIDGVLAVGALGRTGTYPADCASADHECIPRGEDPADYVADFSSRVRDQDFVAPGVGIISTVGRSEWGVMDGTSQAAPVVSALAARVLAESGLLEYGRTVERARAVIAQVRQRAKSLGFPVDLEGTGLIEHQG